MGIVWRFSLSFLCSLDPHPHSGHQQHQAGDEQHDPSGAIHCVFSYKTSLVLDVFANGIAQGGLGAASNGPFRAITTNISRLSAEGKN